MAYLGNSNSVQNFTPAVDYFNGNGSTIAFTLSRTVGSAFDLQAFIENVPQNPSSAFTVAGNVITFTSAPPSGTNNIYVRYTSPVTQLVKPAPGTVSPTEINSAYSLWNLSGSDINYTTGNVGIGTNSPNSFYSEAKNLVVGSGTGGQGMTIYAGTASQSRLMFADGTSGSDAYTGFVQYDHSSNSLQFGTNGGNERMRITSAGNIGIGTTSPSATLDVGSSVTRSGAAQNNIYADYRITAATTGVVSSFASRIVGIGGSTYTIPDAAVYKADPIVAQTGVTVTNSYGLYIGNMKDPVSGGSVTNGYGIYQSHSSNYNYFAGNIGVGNIPSSTFQIQTGSDHGITTGRYIHRLGSGSGGSENIEYGGSFFLYHDGRTCSTPGFGNIAVNRSGPAFSCRNNGGGAAYYAEAGGFTGPSDYRLKENIVPITDGIDRVKQLNPVVFDYTDEAHWEDGNARHDGFLAHEVKEVVPDAVVGEKDAVDEDGKMIIQALDKSRLIPLLTAAIKEQQAIIEDLKARIEVLENQ